MRLQILTFLCAMVITGTISAQQVHLGVKGGLNLYDLSNSNFDPMLGVHLGLLGHIHLSQKFALQPELVYSTQGAKFANSDNSLNLAYVNVPILLQYMFDNGFRIQAGPQLGVLTSAKSVLGDNKVDVKNEFKNIDLGLGFGASYVHPPSGYGVDARYNLGMTNISENASNDFKNRGFQLGVFYLLGHKH